MQVIKAFKKETVIQGLTKDVVVTIEIDQDDIDFSYWDADLAKDTQADLAAGRVGCVWVNVRASFPDLGHYEGSDSLGQVIVRASHDSAVKDVLQTAKDHGMVQTAIDDLIKNVLNGQNELNAFLGKVA